jgi:hypothetical protein
LPNRPNKHHEAFRARRRRLEVRDVLSIFVFGAGNSLEYAPEGAGRVDLLGASVRMYVCVVHLWGAVGLPCVAGIPYTGYVCSLCSMHCSCGLINTIISIAKDKSSNLQR